MINNEKDLEDYICDNQEEFIELLKQVVTIEDEITFVGRQVYIGKDNIADLVYCYNFDEHNKYFIIVELKNRKLELKDLAQLSRYIGTLQTKLDNDKPNNYNVVYGVFVSHGLSNDFQEIDVSKTLHDIFFIKFIPKFTFQIENYIKKQEYIDNLKLDERITSLYGGKDES